MVSNWKYFLQASEAVFALDSETRNGIEAVRVIGSDGEEGGCA